MDIEVHQAFNTLNRTGLAPEFLQERGYLPKGLVGILMAASRSPMLVRQTETGGGWRRLDHGTNLVASTALIQLQCRLCRTAGNWFRPQGYQIRFGLWQHPMIDLPHVNGCAAVRAYEYLIENFDEASLDEFEEELKRGQA